MYVCLPYLTEVQFEQDILTSIHHTCKVNMCTLAVCKKYFFRGSPPPSHLMQLQKIIEFRDREWNELGQNFKSVRACYKLTGTSIWCHTLYSMQQRQCASLWLSSYIHVQHHCNAVKKSEIAWDWKFLATLEKKTFFTQRKGICIHVYFICMVCQS